MKKTYRSLILFLLAAGFDGLTAFFGLFSAGLTFFVASADLTRFNPGAVTADGCLPEEFEEFFDVPLTVPTAFFAAFPAVFGATFPAVFAAVSRVVFFIVGIACWNHIR